MRITIKLLKREAFTFILNKFLGMDRSNEKLASHSLLEPLLVMLIVLREFLRPHALDGILDQSRHILPLELPVLLQPDILSLDLTEDVLDGVELRRIGGDVPDRSVQLLDLGLDDSRVVHAGVIEDQNFIGLEVVQVVL
jgi:hypothetical protein